MVTKYFIAKADGADITGADLSILLDENGELFAADENNAAEQFKNTFGGELQIGYVAYEDPDKKVFFAHTPINTLPSGWNFYKFIELNPARCKDFELINKVVEKLGYKVN